MKDIDWADRSESSVLLPDEIMHHEVNKSEVRHFVTPSNKGPPLFRRNNSLPNIRYNTIDSAVDDRWGSSRSEQRVADSSPAYRGNRSPSAVKRTFKMKNKKKSKSDGKMKSHSAHSKTISLPGTEDGEDGPLGQQKKTIVEKRSQKGLSKSLRENRTMNIILGLEEEESMTFNHGATKDSSPRKVRNRMQEALENLKRDLNEPPLEGELALNDSASDVSGKETRSKRSVKKRKTKRELKVKNEKEDDTSPVSILLNDEALNSSYESLPEPLTSRASSLPMSSKILQEHRTAGKVSPRTRSGKATVIKSEYDGTHTASLHGRGRVTTEPLKDRKTSTRKTTEVDKRPRPRSTGALTRVRKKNSDRVEITSSSAPTTPTAATVRKKVGSRPRRTVDLLKSYDVKPHVPTFEGNNRDDPYELFLASGATTPYQEWLDGQKEIDTGKSTPSGPLEVATIDSKPKRRGSTGALVDRWEQLLAKNRSLASPTTPNEQGSKTAVVAESRKDEYDLFLQSGESCGFHEWKQRRANEHGPSTSPSSLHKQQVCNPARRRGSAGKMAQKWEEELLPSLSGSWHGISSSEHSASRQGRRGPTGANANKSKGWASERAFRTIPFGPDDDQTFETNQRSVNKHTFSASKRGDRESDADDKSQPLQRVKRRNSTGVEEDPSQKEDEGPKFNRQVEALVSPLTIRIKVGKKLTAEPAVLTKKKHTNSSKRATVSRKPNSLIGITSPPLSAGLVAGAIPFDGDSSASAHADAALARKTKRSKARQALKVK